MKNLKALIVPIEDQRGWGLLEILIAFVIISLCLLLYFRVFQDSTDHQQRNQLQRLSIARAETLMELIHANPSGFDIGRTDGASRGIRWTVEITPYVEEGLDYIDGSGLERALFNVSVTTQSELGQSFVLHSLAIR